MDSQDCSAGQGPALDSAALVNRTNLDSPEFQEFKEGDFLHYALVYPNDVEVKRQKVGDQQQVGGGCRGPVTHFSPKSRRNLIKKLQRWADAPHLFQTFTYSDSILHLRYGGEYPGIEELCQRIRYDLNRWSKKIPAAVPVRYLWRLEIEARKSGPWAGYLFPHLHLVLSLQGDDFAAVPMLLGKVWHDVACPGDEKHLRVALHSKSWEWLNNDKKLMYYVSKYCAKVSSPIEDFDRETGEVFSYRLGRMWGFTRDCEFYEPTVKLMSKRAFDVFRRSARRHITAIYRGSKRSFPRALKMKFRLRQSFSWFISKDTFEKLIFLGVPFGSVRDIRATPDLPF